MIVASPKWKGERHRRDDPISLWRLELEGGIMIVVHRLHGAPGWFLTMRGMGRNYNDRDLGLEDEEAAKARALIKAKSEIDTQIDIFMRVSDELENFEG